MAGRRIGIVVVLLLLAGAALLVTLPHAASAMRIGSLSLIWWYGALVAPLVATCVTTAVLLRSLPPADHEPPTAPPA